jgi:hypothetical protein
MAALAAIVLLWFDGTVEFTGYQVLLVILAAMALRRLHPPEVVEQDDELLRLRIRPVGRPRYTAPPQLEKIERLVAFGKTTAFDAERRLIPLLREIAAEQLESRHGIDLVGQPDKARRLLGDEGWDLLQPDRPPPGDRLAPGLDLDRMDSAVKAIEGIS